MRKEGRSSDTVAHSPEDRRHALLTNQPFPMLARFSCPTHSARWNHNPPLTFSIINPTNSPTHYHRPLSLILFECNSYLSSVVIFDRHRLSVHSFSSLPASLAINILRCRIPVEQPSRQYFATYLVRHSGEQVLPTRPCHTSSSPLRIPIREKRSQTGGREPAGDSKSRPSTSFVDGLVLA